MSRLQQAAIINRELSTDVSLGESFHLLSGCRAVSARCLLLHFCMFVDLQIPPALSCHCADFFFCFINSCALFPESLLLCSQSVLMFFDLMSVCLNPVVSHLFLLALCSLFSHVTSLRYWNYLFFYVFPFLYWTVCLRRLLCLYLIYTELNLLFCFSHCQLQPLSLLCLG